jgi:hypothetical protein
MHKITVVSILLSFSIVAFGQQKEEISLIQADSTWGREIIQLPFWFAPEINYTGHEDIRFAKGWEDINSVGFWTYVFAWDINLKTNPTAQFFEDNFKLYFDGLMKVVNEDTLLTIPKTKASFILKLENMLQVYSKIPKEIYGLEQLTKELQGMMVKN